MKTPAANPSDTFHAPLPPRSVWRRLLPVLVIMPTICGVLSGLITWIHVGWAPDFGWRWLKAFSTALPVLPLGLVSMGLLQRAIEPVASHFPAWGVKTVLALGSALVMETLMATAVPFSNHGWSGAFAGQWQVAFVRSLPVGVLIGLTMAFVIRPRLVRWMASA